MSSFGHGFCFFPFRLWSHVYLASVFWIKTNTNERHEHKLEAHVFQMNVTCFSIFKRNISFIFSSFKFYFQCNNYPAQFQNENINIFEEVKKRLRLLAVNAQSHGFIINNREELNKNCIVKTFFGVVSFCKIKSKHRLYLWVAAIPQLHQLVNKKK